MTMNVNSSIHLFFIRDLIRSHLIGCSPGPLTNSFPVLLDHGSNSNQLRLVFISGAANRVVKDALCMLNL